VKEIKKWKKMSKVVIVDDEPDIRKMLTLLIQKEGYDTKVAIDGSDFLDKIESFNPDIVTLDMMMPGMKTNEILEKLEKKKSNPKVILLTAVRFNRDKKTIFEQGNVVDYILKPFDVDLLIDAMKKHS